MRLSQRISRRKNPRRRGPSGPTGPPVPGQRVLAFDHRGRKFEDHAEHEYAEFVRDHPELDEQLVTNELVKQFGNPATWGDVFRHIGLDERVHRNESLKECGMSDQIAPYVSVPSSVQLMKSA